MAETLAIPDPDYADPKETFAFFGLTFYYAQVLEQGVVNLAVALHAKGVPGLTVHDIVKLYDPMEHKTFGQVLATARKAVDIPEPLAQRLREALGKRNYLAHRFFVEHDVDDMTEQGRRRMIDELRDILAFLKNVDEDMDVVWRSAWEALGLTEEWWDEQYRRYAAAHGLAGVQPSRPTDAAGP